MIFGSVVGTGRNALFSHTVRRLADRSDVKKERNYNRVRDNGAISMYRNAYEEM